MVERGRLRVQPVLLAAVFGLTENGPGDWSLDAGFGKPRWGTAWAFAALAAGAAGSAATLASARMEEADDVAEGTAEEAATAEASAS